MRLNAGTAAKPRWLGVVVTSGYFSGVVLLRIEELAAAGATPPDGAR